MKIERVLLITSAFYPENSPRSFRATELAKGMTRMGCEVTVMTLPRGSDTIDFCKANGIRLDVLPTRKFGRLSWSGRWGQIISRIINRFLLQVLEYPDIELVWSFSSRLKLKMANFDLLVSFSVPYPVHWGTALALARMPKGRPIWVADCGDPYMGNESDSFGKAFYFGSIERWTFRRADLITIPLEAARAAYYEEFHSKIKVIPQGVNFAEMEAKRVSYRPNEILSFAYAGSLIPKKRDPRPFIEFLLRIDLDFRFYIFTESTSLVESLVKRSGGRIVLSRYIPREELVAFLSSMDFVINIENVSQTQAPSKLIDYHLAGRPVLSIRSNQVDFADFISFASGNYDRRLIIENVDSFRIENVANAFLQVASELDHGRI